MFFKPFVFGKKTGFLKNFADPPEAGGIFQKTGLFSKKKTVQKQKKKLFLDFFLANENIFRYFGELSKGNTCQ